MSHRPGRRQLGKDFVTSALEGEYIWWPSQRAELWRRCCSSWSKQGHKARQDGGRHSQRERCNACRANPQYGQEEVPLAMSGSHFRLFESNAYFYWSFLDAYIRQSYCRAVEGWVQNPKPNLDLCFMSDYPNSPELWSVWNPDLDQNFVAQL